MKAVQGKSSKNGNAMELGEEGQEGERGREMAKAALSIAELGELSKCARVFNSPLIWNTTHHRRPPNGKPLSTNGEWGERECQCGYVLQITSQIAIYHRRACTSNSQGQRNGHSRDGKYGSPGSCRSGEVFIRTLFETAAEFEVI